MIPERFTNDSRIVPPLAYARGAGSREQGGRSREVSHPCLSGNWGIGDRPLMDALAPLAGVIA